MKMKSLLGLAAAAMLVLGSCATSNEVNGGGVFQKRKYTKGFYWNKGTSANESASVLKSEKLKADEVNSFNTFDTEKSSENEVNSSALNSAQSPNLFQKTEKEVAISKKQNVNSLKSIKSNAVVEWTANPIKKIVQSQSKSVKEAVSRAKAPRNDGQLGYLLGIILLVILLLLLFTVLDAILGGLLSWILRIVLLVVIIVLVLRLLGVL
jgi:hypothetical protein